MAAISLSSTLLNVCIIEIMLEWNKENKKRIKLTRNNDIKHIFFCG
jgi:hypothetical protein